MAELSDKQKKAFLERLQRLRILLVDNSKYSRSLLINQLATYHIRGVVECNDSVEAIKYLKGMGIDLVLLEYEMTPLNGADLARMIRREPSIKNQEVPIIMISGFSDVTHVQEASNAGINEFLSKPVAADALYKRIAHTFLNPRPFIRTDTYVGPAPRRKKAAPPAAAD